MNKALSKELQTHTGNGDNCRDKYIYNLPKSHPSNLLEPLRNAEVTLDNDNEMMNFVEELADYLNDFPERNVIGLENKLKQANMDSLYDEAAILKERFAKKLYRGQLSHNSQYLYAQSLALINTYFAHKIKPLLNEGAPKSIIEKELLDEVFIPVLNNITKVDITINIDHVRGMLYFLTGKCHIKWS
ncbi:ABC-three component system protein [Thiothrix fructosivorans]|jgi:hypothetical protein|uniref:ABC-three component systems C-terminal domain-containing protein n=1 Tax=Thiothrix fructosivorans TaxID=111770 RepID=A0A8B0SLU8_9GAMM|nr:ABC-three component system protein [Thiothrix fructosivorans]MBO0612595.1 hypothetical protein [Thiothrix fructosivorans]QTX11934.1 hypothetical protein J1836_006240 [Thiothrix fructosivorans]